MIIIILLIGLLSSLKTPRTKKLHTYYLDKYYLARPENKNLTLDQILSKSSKEIEYGILGITDEIKHTLNLSYATVALAMTSIIHFFEMNDVLVNKKRLEKFKGDNVAKFEYRSYTTEEISKLISLCDERT